MVEKGCSGLCAATTCCGSEWRVVESPFGGCFRLLALVVVPARAAALLLPVLALPRFGCGDGSVVGRSDDGLATPDALTSLRRGVHQCAHEPPEQQTPVVGVATVEAEHELVEVLLEMVPFDRALMCAENPPLQQRRHPMNVREMDVRRLWQTVQRGRLVVVVQTSVSEQVNGDRVRGQAVGENSRCLLYTSPSPRDG